MSRSDSESDQQGRQHRGGVITGVHGGGVDHEHEEHGQQRLHDDTPGGGGVGANTVHAEVPCNGGKVKDGGSSDSSDGLGNDVNWKMTPCEKGENLFYSLINTYGFDQRKLSANKQSKRDSWV